MRTPNHPGEAHAAMRGGAAVHPLVQLVDGLRRGFQQRLQPLLAPTLAGVETELRRQMQDESPGEALVEQVANVAVLRTEISRVERRWQEQLGEAFRGWPRQQVAAQRVDAYTLVSEEELQHQLVGQPLIEALERRHAEVLEIIDSRLWTLAAGLGVQARPTNPFAPRAVMEALRGTFPRSECDPDVCALLLRRYARLALDGLVEAYADLNAGLADAGLAMSSGNDLGLLVPPPPGVAAAERGSIWSDDNALAPTESSWRLGGASRGGSARDAVRGNALRQRAASQAPAADGDGRRPFGDKEFLSVLSLVQGSETPRSPERVSGSIAAHLRESLLDAASGLGMSREATAPAPAHEAGIAVVGALFESLRTGHALDPDANARLARLAYPYLRLALSDPLLFDSPSHPAVEVLSALVDAWDGAGGDEADAELQAVAAEVADRIANDYHGDEHVFEQAQALMQARTEPLRRRADNAERRAAQSLLGRSRLRAARVRADRELRARLEGRPLLATVATFLGDQWRQSLVQAWLRDGQESSRFADALALGDAVVKLDADAERAEGRAVADGLVAIERPLRDCYVACGLDESGAQSLLAELVGELARPDARRVAADFTPMAGDDGDDGAANDADGADGLRLEPGQVLVQQAESLRRLRVAWVSPFGGEHLLVNRQGIRQALMSPAEIAAQVAHGEMAVRDPAPPVEAAITRLLADADAG